ncbi:MAG: MarR family winged helix-turn-helix transcriptional regulator [Pseudomonadales bacterium]
MRPNAQIPGNNRFVEPMQSLGYLSRINFRLFSRLLEQRTVTHGVTGGQWRLLRVLWEQDHITQKELSNRVGTKEATNVLAVRSLVRAGLAKRSRCTQDKRKIFITLTPRARRLQARLMPIVADLNDAAVAGIDPEEVRITRKVLAQTYANLERQLEAPTGSHE